MKLSSLLDQAIVQNEMNAFKALKQQERVDDGICD
jgi:hypothetical protein